MPPLLSRPPLPVPTSCPPEALPPKSPRDYELHFSHANLCFPPPSGTLTLLPCGLLHFWMTWIDVGIKPKCASSGFHLLALGQPLSLRTL